MYEQKKISPALTSGLRLGRNALVLALILGAFGFAIAENTGKVVPGADENTPSLAFYFDWLSSQYEGTTEEQTLKFMDFFQWMHDEYGMVLDIYSLDVGNIDDGPYTAGVGRLIPYHYGTMESQEFQDQFPNGFAPLVEKAKTFGARLGIWLGPDGFGTTPEEQQARIDMLRSFCRDYNFMLLKLDGVAGGLRPEKQGILAKTLKECREYCPDLIVLNERLELGEAEPYATTSLWKGAETYIGVFMNNTTTAPHHRVGSISRALTPDLSRLYEDHGVCFNTYLDYWEDDFVLQAFNRSLIMAPEIYGTPWFLRDSEYPKMARLFNLHRNFREILVSGFQLPEDQYGPYAVSRGDDNTRFLTLRNLSWNTQTYTVDLDNSIGLNEGTKVTVRRFHPSERILGTFNRGESIDIEVLPFRTSLICISTEPIDEIGIAGTDYEIIRDVPGEPVEVELLGMPGTKTAISLATENRKFKTAELDGEKVNKLVRGKEIQVDFPGRAFDQSWHRKIGDLKQATVPSDAEALYEATCFAADNNALEVRAVERSGASDIPQVQAARESFFEDDMFVNRGIWDKYLFDGDMSTFFIARLDNKALRIDFGKTISPDEIVVRIRPRTEYDLNPTMNSFADSTVAEVSTDLKTWHPIDIGTGGKGTIAIAKVREDMPVRYVRIHGAPQRIAEVEAYRNGTLLDRSDWRASNLFNSYADNPAVSAWSYTYTPQEIPPKSKLAVALEGQHGNEGAYAALRIDGKIYGAPDRSLPFPSNTWEYYNAESGSNYTYYFPLEESMVGKKIEIIVLVLENGTNEIKPAAWLTTYPIPYVSRTLVLSAQK